MVETGSGDDAQLDEELDSLIVVNASKVAVNGEGRVVGGSVSRRFEFPWHVSSERAGMVAFLRCMYCSTNIFSVTSVQILILWLVSVQSASDFARMHLHDSSAFLSQPHYHFAGE